MAGLHITLQSRHNYGFLPNYHVIFILKPQYPTSNNKFLSRAFIEHLLATAWRRQHLVRRREGQLLWCNLFKLTPSSIGGLGKNIQVPLKGSVCRHRRDGAEAWARRSRGQGWGGWGGGVKHCREREEQHSLVGHTQCHSGTLFLVSSAQAALQDLAFNRLV